MIWCQIHQCQHTLLRISQRKEKEVRKGRVSVGNRDCRAARWSKDTKGSADDHLLIWASHPTPTWPVTPDKDSPPPLDCPCPHFLPCFLLGHLAALQDTQMWDKDDTRFSGDVELPLIKRWPVQAGGWFIAYQIEVCWR